MDSRRTCYRRGCRYWLLAIELNYGVQQDGLDMQLILSSVAPLYVSATPQKPGICTTYETVFGRSINRQCLPILPPYVIVHPSGIHGGSLSSYRPYPCNNSVLLQPSRFSTMGILPLLVIMNVTSSSPLLTS